MAKQPENRRGEIGGKLAEEHPMAALIERAYAVFAGPKPTELGVCEFCCMDKKIETDFLNPPVRELPLRYVRDWYTGATYPPIPFAT